jgi:hypothetical protein
MRDGFQIAVALSRRLLPGNFAGNHKFRSALLAKLVGLAEHQDPTIETRIGSATVSVSRLTYG